MKRLSQGRRRQPNVGLIAENVELVHAWNAIRHSVSEEEESWMVLSYHAGDKSGEPGSKPVLMAHGSGDLGNAMEQIQALQFCPGWLYWIYLRVDPEHISGTGRFRAESNPAHFSDNFHSSQSKFIFISFCLPTPSNAMLPSMSRRLQEHRPVLTKMLNHHLYTEARSLNDISESTMLNKVYRLFPHADALILTISFDSDELPPVMLRTDRHTTLDELKARIASSYFPGKANSEPSEAGIEVSRVVERDNRDVMKMLLDRSRTQSAQGKALRSEDDVAELFRQSAMSRLTTKLEGGGASLMDLGVSTGDELHVEHAKGAQRMSGKGKGVVERRKKQVDDFLKLRADAEQHRQPLYTNLRRGASVQNFTDIGPTTNAARPPPTPPPVLTKKPSFGQRIFSQLKGGRPALKHVQSPSSRVLKRCESVDQLTKFNHSAQLLRELAEEAEHLGARIVDNEDLVVFPNKTLGQGKTARVREGLLLCRLDDKAVSSGLGPKARQSMIPMSNRNSWNRLRKKSMVLKQSDFLASIQEEADEGGQEGERREPERESRISRRPSALAETLPPSKQDAVLGMSDNNNVACIKVAVKEFTARFVTKAVFEIFQEEISVLVGLNHPNIVQILGVYIDLAPRLQEIKAGHESSLAIMYELMPRGSLDQLRMEREDWAALPLTIKYKMALDVARGVEYLHTRPTPIMHRDLKGANLLIDEDLTLKIGDFGISAKSSDEEAAHTKLGTAGWVAPEVFSEDGYGIACDIYSLGVILWELITSERNPLEGIEEARYVPMLREGKRPPLPFPETDHEVMYHQLVKRCWSFEPSKRPSATQVREALEDVFMAAVQG